MAIRTVITRGYGNGTFNGTIPLVVTRGYAIGASVVPSTAGIEITAPGSRLQFTATGSTLSVTAGSQPHFTAPKR